MIMGFMILFYLAYLYIFEHMNWEIGICWFLGIFSYGIKFSMYLFL